MIAGQHAIVSYLNNADINNYALMVLGQLKTVASGWTLISLNRYAADG
jgi:hypothetical protein